MFLSDDKDHEILLEAFLLDKAFYDLNNRSDWMYILLQGIIELAKITFQDSRP